MKYELLYQAIEFNQIAGDIKDFISDIWDADVHTTKMIGDPLGYYSSIKQPSIVYIGEYVHYDTNDSNNVIAHIDWGNENEIVFTVLSENGIGNSISFYYKKFYYKITDLWKFENNRLSLYIPEEIKDEITRTMDYSNCKRKETVYE